MKKTTLVSIFSFIFLMLSSLFAYLFKNTNFGSEWISLLLGLFIMGVSGVIAFVNKKSFVSNIVCFLLNSIALGLYIRTWYNFRNFNNSLLIITLVSLSCLVYLWVFFVALYIPSLSKHYGIFLIVYVIVSFILYFVLIIVSKTTYLSTFGFYMIIQISFIISLDRKSFSINGLFRNVLISSYSIVIVAIIIAVIMLSGDGSGLDLSFGGASDMKSPKGQKVRKQIH